jgi:flagellar biogenesis protein FliO
MVRDKFAAMVITIAAIDKSAQAIAQPNIVRISLALVYLLCFVLLAFHQMNNLYSRRTRRNATSALSNEGLTSDDNPYRPPSSFG